MNDCNILRHKYQRDIATMLCEDGWTSTTKEGMAVADKILDICFPAPADDQEDIPFDQDEIPFNTELTPDKFADEPVTLKLSLHGAGIDKVFSIKAHLEEKENISEEEKDSPFPTSGVIYRSPMGTNAEHKVTKWQFVTGNGDYKLLDISHGVEVTHSSTPFRIYPFITKKDLREHLEFIGKGNLVDIVQ